MAGHYLMLVALPTHGKRGRKDIRKFLQLLISTACIVCFDPQVELHEDKTTKKLCI